MRTPSEDLAIVLAFQELVTRWFANKALSPLLRRPIFSALKIMSISLCRAMAGSSPGRIEQTQSVDYFHRN